MHPLIITLALVPMLVLAGCSTPYDNGGAPSAGPADAPGQRRASAPATQPTTFTGTLRSGMMAIGGETTGWTLVGDAETGGIQVDISRVKDAARQFDGKRVTVTGRMTDTDYVESGRTQVLVAEKIEPAPDPVAR